MKDWAYHLIANLSQGEWVLVAVLFGFIMIASSIGPLGEAVALWLVPPSEVSPDGAVPQDDGAEAGTEAKPTEPGS